MAQQNIIDFLKANKGVKFTVEELAIHLGIRPQSIYQNLNRIREEVYKELKYIDTTSVIWINPDLKCSNIKWCIEESRDRKNNRADIKLVYYYE